MATEPAATSLFAPAEPATSPFRSVPNGWRRGTIDQPPVRRREVVAVLLLAATCDLTIYRGHGFAGYALLFLLAPVLFACGSFRPRLGTVAWFIGAMLALSAARLLWCGSELLVAAGFFLLAAFAMALSGHVPYVAETAVFASQSIASGYQRLIQYARCATASSVSRIPFLNFALPLAAFVGFGTVFVLANPDLLASFSEVLEQVVKQAREWLLRLSLGETVFWIGAAWVATGLLLQASRGHAERSEPRNPPSDGSGEGAEPTATETSRLYPAFRNTLLTVITLFAVYLVFEFRTLWFREFPKGFYYSGYAHEGAAWLTFALALATTVLSLVFRGSVMHDPRLAKLRRLGWLWSAENFVLAVAVYHRMGIYIDFNGMSPMRMVGLYGMSAVVVGFILVLWKIGRGRSFGWLVRRQLWTLAIAIYLFALTPVDAIVVEYNVRRILAGDPAASVQISVHPIRSEGVLLLRPLLDCDDAIIRSGIQAMLAQREKEAEALDNRRQSLGWTAYQLADRLVLKQLRAEHERWSGYDDEEPREAALKRFHAYAYQWY
ncbi:MAG TPA: DUF4153 domain-containing protein [Pirellulales bacterium]|nr:DUF4153 domain-containing protein [Pirellulales bacterium]